MGAFFTSKDGFLTSIGHAPDGAEHAQAGEDEIVTLGEPPGFTHEAPPPGAQWHVRNQRWTDTRTREQRNEQAQLDVLIARKAAYPPLADLADALYWQSHGDNSKMDAYNAAIAAVKAQFPKSN
jgi:hypothetical protein